MNGSTTLVTGNMGGGKTLLTVERAFEHACKGGYVYTNILLRLDQWREAMAERGLVFDPTRVRVFESAEMEEFYQHIGRGTHDMPVMVIYDEAAVGNVNARDWAKLARDFFNFNVLVRKLDIEMYYIAQDSSFLDKQIRKLCQKLIDCRSLKDTRILAGLIRLPIPFLVRVHHTLRGGVPVKDYAELVGPRKDLFRLYDSDALLGKAAEKFCTLGQLKATALQRVQRSQMPLGFPLFASLCAAFSIYF